MLAEKLPELLDFHKDLGSLEAATKVFSFLFYCYISLRWFQFFLFEFWCKLSYKLDFIQIQLKYLAEEMQAVSKGLEKVVQELTASKNDGPVSENFCQVWYIAGQCFHQNKLIMNSNEFGSIYIVEAWPRLCMLQTSM